MVSAIRMTARMTLKLRSLLPRPGGAPQGAGNAGHTSTHRQGTRDAGWPERKGDVDLGSVQSGPGRERSDTHRLPSQEPPRSLSGRHHPCSPSRSHRRRTLHVDTAAGERALPLTPTPLGAGRSRGRHPADTRDGDLEGSAGQASPAVFLPPVRQAGAT